MGALYIQTGQLSEGIKLLEHGLTATPVEPPVLFELHYHLGNAYTQLNNLNSALKHYKAATQQPILTQLKIGAYNNLGNLLLSAGKLTTAKTVYETIL